MDTYLDEFLLNLMFQSTKYYFELNSLLTTDFFDLNLALQIQTNPHSLIFYLLLKHNYLDL